MIVNEMNLCEFNRLPEKEQYRTIWKNGTYLLSITIGAHVFNLFDMGGFYAEIGYDMQQNELVELACFKSTRRLDPYLRGIVLPDINSDSTK